MHLRSAGSLRPAASPLRGDQKTIFPGHFKTGQVNKLDTSRRLLVMTVPSWVPDQEIKPAPMPLLLVQSFVNTWDGDNGSDLLLDPAVARDWLTGAGLWSVSARRSRPGCTSPAACARASARCWWRTAADPGRRPATCNPAGRRAGRPALNCRSGQRAGELRPRARQSARRQAAHPAPGDPRRAGYGTWPRLKACGDPDCRWAFYDRSHSRAGAWCDMATCGNRVENRRLRQRQR